MLGRAPVRHLSCVACVNVRLILPWIGRIKMYSSEISNAAIIWRNSLQKNSKTIINPAANG